MISWQWRTFPNHENLIYYEQLSIEIAGVLYVSFGCDTTV